MNNIIKNASWKVEEECAPQYFSGIGPITYDDFKYNGYRTCSITVRPEMKEKISSFHYDLPIIVSDRKYINWGYCIRAVESKCVHLVADFYNDQGELIKSVRKETAKKIGFEFKQIMKCFKVPCDSCFVKLSIEFIGRITACTYCTPMAYFHE